MSGIPVEGLAFLDAVAVDESDGMAKRLGIDPYLILFGGGSLEMLPRGYAGFPIWEGVRGSWGITHAAGRYQFQPATWTEAAHQNRLIDFSPTSQDIGAWWLAQRDYRARSDRDLLDDLRRDTQLALIASALKQTWTSLSPLTFPERYHDALRRQQAAAGAQDAGEALPAATRTPEPPSARPAAPEGVSADDLNRAESERIIRTLLPPPEPSFVERLWSWLTGR